MLKMLALLSSVIVMFWNVENLFDPRDDKSKNDDDFTLGGKNGWTFKRFETKCNSIAKTISSVASEFGEYPVLIGFSEIENAFVLRHLTEETPLFKLEYGYIHRDSPDLRGIDVALLFRKEYFNPIDVEVLPVHIPGGNPTRDILYVRGILNHTDTINVFVNHWPSKLGGEEASKPRRQAAFNALESKLNELDSTSTIIIMGDFNESNPFVHTLVNQLDVENGGTIKFQGIWEQIDYFFLSDNLMENLLFTPYSPGFLIEGDNTYLGIKPRRTFIGPRYNGGVSDHLPIIIKLF